MQQSVQVQNPRGAQARRTFSRSLVQYPAQSKESSGIGPGCSGIVKMDLYNLSEQPDQMFGYSQGAKCFPYIQSESPFSQFMPISFSPSTKHCHTEPVWDFLVPFMKVREGRQLSGFPKQSLLQAFQVLVPQSLLMGQVFQPHPSWWPSIELILVYEHLIMESREVEHAEW